MSVVTIHTFGFVWFMKGSGRVLSVESSAVTAVPFSLTQFYTIYSRNFVQLNM
jgi:hypothetical protein